MLSAVADADGAAGVAAFADVAAELKYLLTMRLASLGGKLLLV